VWIVAEKCPHCVRTLLDFCGQPAGTGSPPLVVFPFARSPCGMTIPEKRLSPAPSADVEAALAHALRYDGKKAFRLSGESMGKITAAHLVRCLEQAGFVVMKGPPAALPTTCAYAESAARVIARTEKAGE